MGIFQVHPHFGYLNSDVKLVNNGVDDLRVKDSVLGQEYDIPAKSSICIRLSAGEHRFVSKAEEGIVETVVVEDAIKLGGSKEKKTYIFEGTPWALMIMLDRTYFINRETKEQYVEYGVVPEEVVYLNSHYLLFQTEKDNSFFSLDSLSIERTFGDSVFVFNNDIYAVLSVNGGLFLCMWSNKTELHYDYIECDDFAIDEIEQYLYYHQLEHPYALYKKDLKVTNWLTYFIIQRDFRCFVGNHSVVLGSPQRLYIMDTRNNKATLLYNEVTPVTTINEKIIWENELNSSIEESNVKSGFTSSVTLKVYEQGNRWYYIFQIRSILKNVSIAEFFKYGLCLPCEKKRFLNSDVAPVVVRGLNFDCVYIPNEKGIWISTDSSGEYEGKIIESPNHYILISQSIIGTKRKRIYSPDKESFQIEYAESDDVEQVFEKSGLIHTRRKDISDVTKIEDRYFDINRNKLYWYSRFDVLFDGYYRLAEGEDACVYSINGDSRPFPFAKERIIAISEKCNYAFIRDDNGIFIYGYDPENKAWSITPLGKMEIDESFYSKAVFCSDGENIIYQKRGKEFFLRQIGSDVESEFELQSSVIRRNINGYIPYLDFDTHKRPVYVDPVSLTRIEYAAVGQFTFQSVDERITHISHNVVKYYSYEKERYVTAEEYQSYTEKFDYELMTPSNYPKKTGLHYENSKKNRVVYYNANKSWLDERLKSKARFFAGRCEDAFLDLDSACDGYIFRKEYYVREKVNGEIVDIQFPQALYFLNYVSYSYDNRFIIITGRFPMNSSLKGLAMIYDVKERKVVYISTSTMAVWLGVFSSDGSAAYYDSTPNTFLLTKSDNVFSQINVKGRSFLTFSPSGRYLALSCQGYIPYSSGKPHWGHQPSRDVYIIRRDSPFSDLAHYRDHGAEIEGVNVNSSVASATFSSDEKRLMTVSKDGVVVVRNLHLEDAKNPIDDGHPF